MLEKGKSRNFKSKDRMLLKCNDVDMVSAKGLTCKDKRVDMLSGTVLTCKCKGDMLSTKVMTC